MTPIEQFRDAILSAGLTPPDEIVADGKIHRFSSSGKSGDDAGYYLLHLDGVPAGAFGCWRADIKEGWRGDAGRRLTFAERKQQSDIIAVAKRQATTEKNSREENAAAEAKALWKAATEATPDHPYLHRKGIQPHGTRVIQSGSRVGWLAVPMSDGRKVWNLECIAPEKPAEGTDKKGLFGGRRVGCYYLIGEATATAAALLICEGFATAASLHEATDLPVAVAFNAGNLAAVAMALRTKHPNLRIVLCADDDFTNTPNAGLTKATAAAQAIGAGLAVPLFTTTRQTDFNDLAAAEGPTRVQEIIMSAIAAIRPQPAQDQDQDPNQDPNPDKIFPKPAERPAYVVLDEWREADERRYRPGVYFCGMTAEKRDAPARAFESWICSPLHIDALTSDTQDGNFGRLLRFKNSNGRWKKWPMPAAMLGGDGAELRALLLSMGVELDPHRARQQLPAYLQNRLPERKMRCSTTVGWCDGVFVLPDATIGPAAEEVVFQNGERGIDEYATAGTAEEWRDHIAAKAKGNPILILALSAAFSGPLLAKTNSESGGFHYIGGSSIGKSISVDCACSVFGNPERYRRSWKATANGMEGCAAMFNDGFLALDEIGECDPREVGNIVYSLGNGIGKQRASRTGSARSVTRWRVVVLSSGEHSIATVMQAGGHRVKAGQDVRLLGITVERSCGVWDDLHGETSPARFSETLKADARLYYGTVGRAFLEQLTRDTQSFSDAVEKIKLLPAFSAVGDEGQERRVAQRFALVAVAGELATVYGLTGWTEGEATAAAAEMFKVWRAGRPGKGNSEGHATAERVLEFIEKHGDSRFSSVDGPEPHIPVRDRAGWWRDGPDGREFLFTAAGMRETLGVAGFDFTRALDGLVTIGALPKPGGKGERMKQIKVGGKNTKLYPVNPDKLQDPQP